MEYKVRYNMSKYTLTYSEDVQGWTSFFSFIPECMVGMNGRFYSFKDGNLYRHNSSNIRNNFYGVDYSSKIKGVINDDPYSNKFFKTINLEGSEAWDCSIKTDLGEGEINKEWFDKKENDYFGNIRRLEEDESLNMRSAQGIGIASAVTGADISDKQIDFSFNIDSIVSVGDVAFKLSEPTQVTEGGVTKTIFSTITKLGPIKSKSGNSINIDCTDTGITPIATDFIVYVKNAVAESYGTRGYYLEFDLENNSTGAVELFSIGASVFKSNP